MLKRLLFAVLLAISFACEAAVYSLPWGPRPQFVDANGAPMSNGTLQFYAAGSTTPQNTYTDSTGSVTNSNPITLNVRGETPNEVWLTGGLTYKMVLKDSSGSTVWTVDNLSGINDATVSLSEWITGPAPTYISATQFSLAGDQTAAFQVGRRVMTTNSGGTVYSTITAASFGAGITTVTVISDTGSLDSGLSAVSYALLGSTNLSVPTPRGSVTVPAVMVGLEKQGWYSPGNNQLAAAVNGTQAILLKGTAGSSPVLQVNNTAGEAFRAQAGTGSGFAMAAIGRAADNLAIIRGFNSGITAETGRLVFNGDGSVSIGYGNAAGTGLTIDSSGKLTGQNMSPITNSLGADVALNNTANYFDGPSIAQGTSGTWFVTGTVSLIDTSAAGSFALKLWDGTTVCASALTTSSTINLATTVSLSCYITSPAGNMRISVKDAASTSGKILFNASGNSKDSTITAIRIN